MRVQAFMKDTAIYCCLLLALFTQAVFTQNENCELDRNYSRSCETDESNGQYILRQYLGKTSCQSCKLRAIDNVNNIKARYKSCIPEIVQFIDRDADTAYFNTLYQYNKAVKFCKADSIGSSAAEQAKHTWECVSSIGRILKTGTLLSQVGVDEMMNLLDSLARLNPFMTESFLSILDERDAPLVVPIFSSRTVNNTIAVADDSRRAVMLYNVHTGKKVYEHVIDDTLSTQIVSKGETLYSGYLAQPKFRTIEIGNDGSMVVIGSIPVTKTHVDGKLHLSSKTYYCRIDPHRQTQQIVGIVNVCQDLYNFTYENSRIHGDSILITSPTWRISETSYDSLNCLSIVNLKTCEKSQYSRIDDIYRHLDIGTNLCTAHAAIIDGVVYTTQTLSPWIVREGKADCILKCNPLFESQSKEAPITGKILARSGETPFQRSDEYMPKIYTIALFSVGERYIVHVDFVPEEGRAGCMLFDVESDKARYTRNIRYGAFATEGDSCFVIISKSSSGYKVYQYEINHLNP